MGMLDQGLLFDETRSVWVEEDATTAALRRELAELKRDYDALQRVLETERSRKAVELRAQRIEALSEAAKIADEITSGYRSMRDAPYIGDSSRTTCDERAHGADKVGDGIRVLIAMVTQ